MEGNSSHSFNVYLILWDQKNDISGFIVSCLSKRKIVLPNNIVKRADEGFSCQKTPEGMHLEGTIGKRQLDIDKERGGI